MLDRPKRNYGATLDRITVPPVAAPPLLGQEYQVRNHIAAAPAGRLG